MSVRFCHPRVLLLDQFNRRTGAVVETRATVAYQVVGDELVLGASYCSTKDNFCRKTGRDKATERLQANPVRIPVAGLSKFSPSEVTSIVKEFLNVLNLPGRPREFKKIFID